LKSTLFKIFSYLFPRVQKTVYSEINGDIEITWQNGRKVLNTKNANYSYGKLHKIMQFCLKKVNLTTVQEVLLLGLGGGSAVKILREELGYKNKMTAVEIDPEVITIAKEEFEISEDKKTSIICQDALAYVDNEATKYDLIIIDIFIDIQVPEEFYTLHFWERVSEITQKGGSVIFNAGMNNRLDSKLNEIIESSREFSFSRHYNIAGFNTILIGVKNK